MNIKPYLALFRIRYTNSLQYRAAAIAGLATQFAWGFLLILGFYAFYQTDPAALPMTMQQTASYIWMQQAFMMLFFVWFFDMSIFESIESGHIAYELARPVDLYGRWFAQTSANRIASATLRCLPIFVVGVFLPYHMRLVFPGAMQFGLFVISMFLAMGVVVSFTMLVYVSAFKTINSLGTRIAVGIAGDFLSGGIIPVPFCPATLQFVVELSPFGAMMNMPLRIFNGHLYGTELARGMVLQVFWLVVLIMVGRLWMKRSLKKVIVQGG